MVLIFCSGFKCGHFDMASTKVYGYRHQLYTLRVYYLSSGYIIYLWLSNSGDGTPGPSSKANNQDHDEVGVISSKETEKDILHILCFVECVLLPSGTGNVSSLYIIL